MCNSAVLFFYCNSELQNLHSFPTRRSSDLIGVAIDTPSGLIVPVIKNVSSLSLLSIASELSRLRLLRSEEHTSELQSHSELVCRLLLEKIKVPTDPAPS